MARPRAAWLLLLRAGVPAGGHGPAPFPLDARGAWSVVLDANGSASLKPGQPPAVPLAAAWGSYRDQINQTGWAVLDVHSSAAESGARQSYAAGFLEGALSHERMAQHQVNMWGVDFGERGLGSMPRGVHLFVERNLAWMRHQAQELGAEQPYWALVGFLLEQLRGLTDGFNSARGALGEASIPEVQVLMHSMVDTDMDDLVTAIEADGHYVNEHYRHQRRRRSRNPRHRGHCSALVQPAPGNTDLWVGHTTWDEYRSMLRVIKYFDLPLPGAVARRLVFTSNPGSLYSGDDFYVNDKGLTIMETSIENYNKSRWVDVRPESLLTWARATVATRLATSGEEWTELELKHQSGTCNNQWMVVDYKRFTPGKPLLNGTLWVSEAMPGRSRRADATEVLLRQGSWPSYNIPYFKDIWAAGGYGLMQERHPRHADLYSFTRDPRALMFARARSEGWVTSVSSFMQLLRYNHRGDHLARGDACNGISARCDLNPQSQLNYDCFGAIDGKITGWRQGFDDLSFYAVSSPTFSAEERPFTWSIQNETVDGCGRDQHRGHPDAFGFAWYALPSSVQQQAPWTKAERVTVEWWAGAMCVTLSALALRWGSTVLRGRRRCGQDMTPTSDGCDGYSRL